MKLTAAEVAQVLYCMDQMASDYSEDEEPDFSDFMKAFQKLDDYAGTLKE